MSHDPFVDLVMPAKQMPNQAFFTAEEARRVIAAANGKYKTLYWLAAETGMRPGELCALRVEDIDLLNLTVGISRSVWGGEFQTPKTRNAYRRMAISRQLADYLRSYFAATAPNILGLVVASFTGKPLGPSQVMRQELKPLCIKLGIFPKGLKAFRHCSATMMDQAGVPTKVRQERLGHAPGSKVTDFHYTHAMGADDRNAAAAMGNWLAGSTVQ